MGPILLLLAALLWGSAFVAQKLAAEHLGPFAVTCARNVIGGAFIYLCFRLRLRLWGRAGIPPGARSFSPRAFAGGVASRSSSRRCRSRSASSTRRPASPPS